jgi:hypothetical protein
MPTANPTHLEGRVDVVSTVTGKADVRLGGLTVDAEGSVVNDSAHASGFQANFAAGMGGPSEEVTTVGGPGASFEHEVIRGALNELGVTDSATSGEGDVSPTSLHLEFDSPKGDSE